MEIFHDPFSRASLPLRIHFLRCELEKRFLEISLRLPPPSHYDEELARQWESSQMACRLVKDVIFSHSERQLVYYVFSNILWGILSFFVKSFFHFG